MSNGLHAGGAGEFEFLGFNKLFNSASLLRATYWR